MKTKASLKKSTSSKTAVKQKRSSLKVVVNNNKKSVSSSKGPQKISKKSSKGVAKKSRFDEGMIKVTKAVSGRANKAAKMVKKVMQDNIDTTLLKLSPNMQKTLDAIVSKIEETPVHIQDLRGLAFRVLKHATEINEALKDKISGVASHIKK